MKVPRMIFIVAAIGALFAATPALARHRHHPAAPATREADWSGWQGEAIARATQRMQDAPGLTNELAPDAKATATGGPVGGVPGFNGGN